MSRFQLWPLEAPGMPLPGPSFQAYAQRLGDPPLTLVGSGKLATVSAWGERLRQLYLAALYDDQFQLPVAVRGALTTAPLVPGHLLNTPARNYEGGPRPADVMLIGKNPGRDELRHGLNFVGPSSTPLWDALYELQVPEDEWGRWYATNLVKWPQLDLQSDTLPAGQKQDCAVLLEQELRLVAPKYVLCLGSDASKWVVSDHDRIRGKSAGSGVNALVGRTVTRTLPMHLPGQQPRYHTIQIMALTHPAQVHRTPELYEQFRAQLALFLRLTRGDDVGSVEAGLRHVNVYKAEHLRRIVDECLADPNPERRIIGIDGEWEGQHPGEPGSYLRTIQFSTRPKEGVVVVLRHQGGAPAFTPSIEHAIVELRRLCKARPGYAPRIGGHFLRADLPWLIDAGLDLRDEYAPAAPEQLRVAGGWETGLAYHAVNEATSYRLTDVMVRLTEAPVYDAGLKEHITDYCRQHDIDKEDLEGYGFLPSWILHPDPWEPEGRCNYAAYDPDVTRRIGVRHLAEGGLLDRDYRGVSCWEPYWRNHAASLGILEMERRGILLDRDRVDNLVRHFSTARDRLLADFRRRINWPTFNPESQPQCVALLFGDGYVAPTPSGERKQVRPLQQTLPDVPGPVDALTLGLTPVKSTGRRPKMWADLVARGETAAYNPSCDKEVLGILGHQHPLAMQLRDIKFLGKTLQGPLRNPIRDRSGAVVLDEDGHMEYEKGLVAVACHDGKVRTHISQNKETGRGASARPPLQNISKRRESDYRAIMGYWGKDEHGNRCVRGRYSCLQDALCPGPDWAPLFTEPQYQYAIRSVFRATPGYLLVEVDYVGAELAMLAWLSGDPTMIEHVRRNNLPEDHPDFYDIHSQTAVKAFRLRCPATKRGLQELGKTSLRVAAKNVNFGIPYGRQAPAIVRQCREEGTHVTEEETQALIDAYFETYPKVAPFLAECRWRSQNTRMIAGPFGRFRRFVGARDRSVVSEQERASQNFPIQNGVADALWTAIANFHRYQRQRPDFEFHLLLPVHDALLFEVPYANLRELVIDERDAAGNIVRPSVIRQCMVNEVPIWPRTLDNRPVPVAQPYFFGIDAEIMLYWGEKAKGDSGKESLRAAGVPEDLIPVVCA